MVGQERHSARRQPAGFHHSRHLQIPPFRFSPSIRPAIPAIIPKGIATAGLVAHVAVSKFRDALPLYRQEKMFERIGVDLSRQTMAGWMVMAAASCAPLMALIQNELLSGPLVNADETPVQVMNEPSRNTIRPFVVGRKNWLFAGHSNGAEASPTVRMTTTNFFHKSLPPNTWRTAWDSCSSSDAYHSATYSNACPVIAYNGSGSIFIFHFLE